MIKYNYLARSPTGKKIKGILQVETESELFEIMTKHNFQLIKYKISKTKKPIISLFSVNRKDLLLLCENINMMLRAGLSLKESIKLVEEVTSKAMLKKTLGEIVKELEKGKSFSNVLQNYPDVFPVFFRTMIKFAEISGNLKEIFTHLIRYYKFDIKIRKKISNTLFYPCLVLALCFAVIIVMSIVIVPSFEQIFKQMKIELPLITKIIIAVSGFVSKYCFLIIILILLIILGLIVFFKTRKGKYFLDYFISKFIVIRRFTQISFTSRFCQCFKILIDSGIPVVSSLEITANLLSNNYLKNRFEFVVDEIKRGNNISNALFSINFFPPLVIETLFISEKSANLSYSLDVLSDLYEEEMHNKLQKLATILEPALIIFIALLVIILIIAVFIPLFSMLDNIGGL
jgi:type IV pilus assembly protein PilC